MSHFSTKINSKSVTPVSRMVLIPTDKIGIKVDPFRHLKYCLLAWGQKEKVLKICFFIFGLKLFGFVSRTLFILKSTNNNEMLMEISATYPIPLLAVAKLGFLLARRKHVRFIFRAVTEQFWDFSLGDAHLVHHLEKRFKFISLFLLGHCLTSNLYVILHLAFPYVPIPKGRTRWLPTLISFPFNQDRSPFYEILFVVLSWNMFISVFGNGFFDFLFVYAAQHLCAQFMILKVILKKLETELMEKYEDITKFHSLTFQREIQDRLKTCIRHHTLLLRYGQELKNLTSLIFGLQLLTTWITLVLMGYKLTENIEEISKSGMLMSFVLSTTMQFTIFAIQSEDIHHQSASIAEAAYQCNWYLFKATAKRGLTLLIMNAQKGINMYGAGLVQINNQLIVNMGQKVFSCITLLQSLKEPK